MQGNHLARVVASFRPDLPALHMSGYPRENIVHGGRLDDGVKYLEKPFTPAALAAKVREVLIQVEPSA
jgi:two-component system, cell cycle sensor histidine kinase and response regulator CckA